MDRTDTIMAKGSTAYFWCNGTRLVPAWPMLSSGGADGAHSRTLGRIVARRTEKQVARTNSLVNKAVM